MNEDIQIWTQVDPSHLTKQFDTRACLLALSPARILPNDTPLWPGRGNQQQQQQRQHTKQKDTHIFCLVVVHIPMKE